jgi:hypothetical protein
MPIRRYLDGFRFDDEAIRVMGIAFEMTCVALRVDTTSQVAERAAKRIIERAKEGERNPDRLCDDALTKLADQSPGPASSYQSDEVRPGMDEIFRLGLDRVPPTK